MNKFGKITLAVLATFAALFLLLYCITDETKGNQILNAAFAEEEPITVVDVEEQAARENGTVIIDESGILIIYTGFETKEDGTYLNFFCRNNTETAQLFLNYEIKQGETYGDNAPVGDYKVTPANGNKTISLLFSGYTCKGEFPDFNSTFDLTVSMEDVHIFGENKIIAEGTATIN